MANLRPYLLMDRLQAARFREETKNDENRLDPQLIRGGGHAGKYALTAAVVRAPEFEARRLAFLLLPEVGLDADEAFPPEPEEDA